MIRVKTIIGFGMPKQGTNKAHSDAPGEEAVKETKRNLGWDENKHFYIPKEALAVFREAVKSGAKAEKDWEALVKNYEKANPELGKVLADTRKNELPDGWEKSLPKFDAVESAATRAYSGEVINAIADTLPQLFGGSADLAPSNNTTIKSSGSFEPETYDGRNIHYGIREHSMGSEMNGMALYGSLIPYGGTFQTFSDYMRPAVQPRRALAYSGDFRLYARFHRLGRRRSDAPIRRTSRRASGDSESQRHSPVRRTRNPRNVASRTAQ